MGSFSCLFGRGALEGKESVLKIKLAIFIGCCWSFVPFSSNYHVHEYSKLYKTFLLKQQQKKRLTNCLNAFSYAALKLLGWTKVMPNIIIRIAKPRRWLKHVIVYPQAAMCISLLFFSNMSSICTGRKLSAFLQLFDMNVNVQAAEFWYSWELVFPSDFLQQNLLSSQPHGIVHQYVLMCNIKLEGIMDIQRSTP